MGRSRVATSVHVQSPSFRRPVTFVLAGANPLAAALALVTTSAVAVLGGELVARYLPPIWFKRVAGAVFIVLGVVYLWESRPAGTGA
jgi:putative Ca2+/H+ antiporter (TMEM165/GDT1 family)